LAIDYDYMLVLKTEANLCISVIKFLYFVDCQKVEEAVFGHQPAKRYTVFPRTYDVDDVQGQLRKSVVTLNMFKIKPLITFFQMIPVNSGSRFCGRERRPVRGKLRLQVE
jgi:hypothetical protein